MTPEAIGPDRHPYLHCSFCGKLRVEVKKLIAGPTTYICDQCIALCHDIVSEPDPMRDAAPDLYRACEAMLEAVTSTDLSLTVKSEDMARAALKKARGEQ